MSVVFTSTSMELSELKEIGTPFASPKMDAESVENELYKYTFQGKWTKVVELYSTEPSVHLRDITSSNDTALHMAINDDREDEVEKLVGIIKRHGHEKALELENDRGETPLHRAAVRGSVRMCECIVEAGDKAFLLSRTNKRGEASIFMAVLHNRKDAFLYLHRAAAGANVSLRRKIDGDTILHSAIKRDHFGKHGTSTQFVNWGLQINIYIYI